MFLFVQPNVAFMGFSFVAFAVFTFIGVFFFLNLFKHKFRSQINARELIWDPEKFLLSAIITSASKPLKIAWLHFVDSLQTSSEMMVSAVERHETGIKGMDQLSTVTTRTQLQRIHLRSLSLRAVRSPPPPRDHKHTK